MLCIFGFMYACMFVCVVVLFHIDLFSFSWLQVCLSKFSSVQCSSIQFSLSVSSVAVLNSRMKSSRKLNIGEVAVISRVTGGPVLGSKGQSLRSQNFSLNTEVRSK